MVMILVFLFHYGCLIHKFISKLNLTFVVSFNAALIEHFQSELGIFLAKQASGVDNSQIVIGLTEALLLSLLE